MPVNALIIRALLQYYLYYGDNFKIECPTGSGKMMNLFEVSKELSDRLTRTFLRDDRGRRPVYGGTEKFQSDPHWRDHSSFTNTSTRTTAPGSVRAIRPGWTGLVAKFIHLYGSIDAKIRWKAARGRLFRKPNVNPVWPVVRKTSPSDEDVRLRKG